MTPSAVSGESPKLLTESMAAESAEYRSLVGTSVSSALMSSSASRPWCRAYRALQCVHGVSLES